MKHEPKKLLAPTNTGKSPSEFLVSSSNLEEVLKYLGYTPTWAPPHHSWTDSLNSYCNHLFPSSIYKLQVGTKSLKSSSIKWDVWFPHAPLPASSRQAERQQPFF